MTLDLITFPKELIIDEYTGLLVRCSFQYFRKQYTGFKPSPEPCLTKLVYIFYSFPSDYLKIIRKSPDQYQMKWCLWGENPVKLYISRKMTDKGKYRWFIGTKNHPQQITMEETTFCAIDPAYCNNKSRSEFYKEFGKPKKHHFIKIMFFNDNGQNRSESEQARATTGAEILFKGFTKRWNLFLKFRKQIEDHDYTSIKL